MVRRWLHLIFIPFALSHIQLSSVSYQPELSYLSHSVLGVMSSRKHEVGRKE